MASFPPLLAVLAEYSNGLASALEIWPRWLLAGLGVALLVAGRTLVWLFVGTVVGCLAFALMTRGLGIEQTNALLIGSLAAGVLGIVLALSVKKIAVGLAGAAIGVFLLDVALREGASWLSAATRAELATHPWLGWAGLLLAGVAGALLMAVLFEWALILLTALAGASLVAQLWPAPGSWLLLEYAALWALGVGVQGRRHWRGKG